MGVPRVTQSTIELILAPATPTLPRVTQSTIELIMGGPLPAPAAAPLPPSGGSSTGRFRCCAEGHVYQAARLAELARFAAERRQAWPYPHLFPPADAQEVNENGRALVGAPGALTTVLRYTVPSSSRFILAGILQAVVTGAFNPGDVLWTVDQNAVVPNVQGMPVQGLDSVPIPLGSSVPWRWWPLIRPYEFSQLSTIRSTAINVNLPPGGFLVSAFLGWLLPVRAGLAPALS